MRRLSPSISVMNSPFSVSVFFRYLKMISQSEMFIASIENTHSSGEHLSNGNLKMNRIYKKYDTHIRKDNKFLH